MVDPISPAARRFLATIDDERAANLSKVLEMYSHMSDEAQLFLERADPQTLKWLVRARPEEITQLEEGISLVRASRTVGRFSRWAIVTVIGVFVAAFSLGDWIAKLVNLIKGGH